MKILSIVCLIIFTSSCSRTLERDYKVVDASHQELPEWVEDLDEWLDDEEDSDDFKENRYYIYSSEAKNDRDTACKIAHANSASSVAAEISTFIKESFAQSKHGDPSKTDKKLAEYIQNDLYKEVKTTVTGAQEYKKYWEKRRFLKDEGATKNWDGFVCTSLIKIPKKMLKVAFKRTEDALAQKADAKAKETVQKIMQQATEDYTKTE
ncbi:MAG: Mn-dependent DtxR family transcriptional regulator [Bacteriovoracaceae bacterium]|jgi:hypothetical protein